jgi:hypothetical protein
LTLLIRSNSFVFLLAIIAGWLVTLPLKVTVRHAAVALGLTALMLVPWTIRNYHISDGAFVPLSVQDGAISGTFNADTAADTKYRWAWRPVPRRDVDIFSTPRSDAELLHDLRSRAITYIKAHPASLYKAFFWNGITRFWDLRHPGYVTRDVDLFEGGRKWVTLVGLVMYWLMLPFMLIGLWRLRHRRAVFVTLVTIGFLSSLLGTAASGTRYRATIEPIIVILACSVLAYPRGRETVDAPVAADAGDSGAGRGPAGVLGRLAGR